MRKLLTSLVYLIIFSCQPASPPYQYIQSPQGQQMVVVRDDNGMEFLMEYALFTSLMNQGGYNTVIHHYHSSPSSYVRYNSSTYSSWKPFRGRSYNPSQYDRPSGFRSSGNSNSPVFKSTSPSSSTPAFKNTTPPSSGFRSSTPSSGFKSSTGSSSSWGSSSGSSKSSGFRSSGSSSSSSSFKSSSSNSGFRSSGSSSYKSSSSSGFRSSKKN